MSFGEYSFFAQQSRTSSAQAKTFCNLFCVDLDKFINLLKIYPFEKEAYYQIKDKVTLLNDPEPFRVSCKGCGTKGHYLSTCPQLHFVPDKEAVIEYYKRQQEEFRANYKRYFRKKYNARRQQRMISIKAKSFCLNHQQNILQFMALFDRPSQIKTIFGHDTKQANAGQEASLRMDQPNTDTQGIEYVVPSIVLQKEGEKTMLNAQQGTNQQSLSIQSEYQASSSFSEVDLDIDRVYNFSIYLPHNNLSKILDAMQKQKALKELDKKIKELEEEDDDLNEVPKSVILHTQQPPESPLPPLQRALSNELHNRRRSLGASPPKQQNLQDSDQIKQFRMIAEKSAEVQKERRLEEDEQSQESDISYAESDNEKTSNDN